MTVTVGQIIGSYRIVQEIARGEYASIYKATHIVLKNRLVALKLLYTMSVSSEQELEQVFQEARILEQLQHPHILPVIDTNVYEKHPYTVTEFAVHGSLRDRLRKQKKQPLSLTEALEILGQIGEGLQFAHDHKIVHSDIKPENILFDASNSVRISDFDNARILRRANEQATNGGGTPSYMAPEQFQGKVRKESDQYALGCIAYELLTGERPFKGDDLPTLTQAHLHSEPQPPSQLNAEVSPGLEQAILRAMAKKYTERHESIVAFIQVLTTAPAGSGRKAGRDGQLILKIGKQAKTDEEEIYYEKTLVEEAANEDDPFAAITIVDEQAPAKRRTVRKTTSVVKKTAATPAKAVDAKTIRKPGTTAEEQEVVKVRKVRNTRPQTVTKKTTQAEENPPPAHPTAAILAREAIRPKQTSPEEEVAKKKVTRVRKVTVSSERSVAARKRTTTKTKATD
ncbi:MAG TPA: serine/threonine-protein kinase [Ktedonobacteraceae bacterium]|jgi:serine/threonine protein kinase